MGLEGDFPFWQSGTILLRIKAATCRQEMEMPMKPLCLMFLVLIFLSGCVSTAPVASSGNVAPVTRPLNVLILGGGSSHDFKRWYGDTDSATLRELPGASVSYTEEV